MVCAGREGERRRCGGFRWKGGRRSLQGRVNRRVKAERGREEEEVQEGRMEGGTAGREEEEWKVCVRSSQPFLTPRRALLAALHSSPRFVYASTTALEPILKKECISIFICGISCTEIISV